MRILLVTSKVPYPLHNGEDLRIFYLVKHLSQRHSIDIVTYGETAEPVDRNVSWLFRHIHIVPRPSDHTGYKRNIIDLFRSFSPSRMYLADPKMESKLKKVLRSDTYDLVWIPAWAMMAYAEYARHIPVFFDVMDDGVLELARELRHCPLFKSPVILKRLITTFLFERKYLSKGRLLSFVSEPDAAVCRRICRAVRVIVNPNGVDTSYFTPLGLEEEHPSLVIEGNMSFGPTVDACVYFCREIFPKITEQFPGTKLLIVGKDPTPEISKLASEKIVITGFVDDVRPYLDRSSVFVCPMRKGAGIKNKILQAWAMAKPVVATSIALGGLRASPGENILVADTPTTFARAVLRLLSDSAIRKSMGQKALETVRKHYTWEQQVELLEAELEKVSGSEP